MNDRKDFQEIVRYMDDKKYELNDKSNPFFTVIQWICAIALIVWGCVWWFNNTYDIVGINEGEYLIIENLRDNKFEVKTFKDYDVSSIRVFNCFIFKKIIGKDDNYLINKKHARAFLYTLHNETPIKSRFGEFKINYTLPRNRDFLIALHIKIGDRMNNILNPMINEMLDTAWSTMSTRNTSFDYIFPYLQNYVTECLSKTFNQISFGMSCVKYDTNIIYELLAEKEKAHRDELLKAYKEALQKKRQALKRRKKGTK